MNYIERREKIRKKCEKLYEDFRPSLVLNNNQLYILDFSNPDTDNMAVRFMIDKMNGDFIITGDSGCAIASWYGKRTPEDIYNYCKDADYFLDKLQCSEYKYTYEREDFIADIEAVRDDFINDRDENDEDEAKEIAKCLEDFSDIESCLDEIPCEPNICMPNPFYGDLEMISDFYEKYGWGGGECTEFGKRIDIRIYQWTYAFRKAYDMITKSK